MDKKLIGLDLTHIADGGLQEKLDKELEKVFDNILDLNTDAKAKRKVTITLTMSANEERTVVDTTMEVKSKFAPQMAEIEQQAETKSDIIDFNKKKVGN